MPTPSSLRSRVLLTLALLAASRLGAHIPLPGMDRALLEALRASGAPAGLPGTFLPPRFSVTGLGVMPYISAALIVLLLSGMVRALRRKRDGDRFARQAFDRIILIVTCFLALIQAYGLSVFLLTTHRQYAVGPTLPPAAFQILVLLTLSAGTLLLVWVAHLITRYGVGNGIALLVLTDSIASFPSAVHDQVRAAHLTGLSRGHLPALAVLLIALVIVLTVFLRARRLVAIMRAGDPPGPEPPRAPAVMLPLRMNAVGIQPIVVAGAILVFPHTLSSFGVISDELVPSATSAGYWVAHSAVVIAATYLLTSWLFSGANTVQRIEQAGFAIAGLPEGVDRGRYLDRLMVWYTAPGALLLCALSAIPLLLVTMGVNVGLAQFFGPTLLVICAIVLGTIGDIRDQRAPVAGTDSEREGNELAPMTTFETRLEADLAGCLLREAGIASRIHANRVIAATGSLMPWEVCRPTFPSLVIHRRLGGGRITLLVPGNRLDEAAEVLGQSFALEDPADTSGPAAPVRGRTPPEASLGQPSNWDKNETEEDAETDRYDRQNAESPPEDRLLMEYLNRGCVAGGRLQSAGSLSCPVQR